MNTKNVTSALMLTFFVSACGGESGDSAQPLSDPLGANSGASTPLDPQAVSSNSGDGGLVPDAEAESALFLGTNHRSIRSLATSIVDGQPVAFVQSNLKSVIDRLELGGLIDSDTREFDCPGGGFGRVSTVDFGSASTDTTTTHRFFECTFDRVVVTGDFSENRRSASDTTGNTIERHYNLSVASNEDRAFVLGSVLFETNERPSEIIGCESDVETMTTLDLEDISASNASDTLRVSALQGSSTVTEFRAFDNASGTECPTVRSVIFGESASVRSQTLDRTLLITRSGSLPVSTDDVADAQLVVADDSTADSRMTITSNVAGNGAVSVDILEAGATQSFLDVWSFGN